MHSTNYENSPVTVMMKTRCMICRKKLKDSVSIEVGMGPDCREMHGYNIEVSAENRRAANLIIAIVATSDYNPAGVLVWSDQLRELGFNQLANVLCDRNSSVVLKRLADGKSILVKTPYNDNMVGAFRRMGAQSKYRMPESRKGFEGYVVPLTKWVELLASIKANFPNTLATGDKGSFIL